MFSTEAFRLSVAERLEAAAEEISVLFQRSVTQYEQEIKRQRRLLDVLLKPRVHLRRIEFQQQLVGKDEEERKEKEQIQQLKEEQEEVFNEQQLCYRGRNPEAKQEPPGMEEEHQEVKQESDDVPTKDESVVGNPDGRVDTLPERCPATEVHQRQPRTGLKKRHQCHHCGRQFKRSYKLKQHIRIHTGERPYVCMLCKKSFSRCHHLARHVRRIHPNQVQSAGLQPQVKMFSGPSSGGAFQQQHLYLEEEEEEQEEQQQEQGWEQLEEVDVGGQVNNAEPPVMEGEQQEVKLEEEEEEEEHDKPVKEEVKEEEEVLGEQLLWDQGWNLQVNPEPPVTKQEENQEVKQESDNDESVLRNPDGSVDTMPERAPAAEGHQHQPPTGPADQAAGVRKPHRCHTCGKHFRVLVQLKRHIRTHTGEKPYSCRACGKCFSDESNMYHHMKIHTGEKPHQCKSCGKQFRHPSYLKEHVMRHNGEKPYSCKVCGKSFTSKRECTIHMRNRFCARLADRVSAIPPF